MAMIEAERVNQDIEKWVKPVAAMALPVAGDTAVIRSQSDYDQAGQVIAACRQKSAWWEKFTKRDPGKPEKDCEPLEGLVFFRYGAYQQSLKTYRLVADKIDSILQPHLKGVRAYDERKQAELRHRQDAEDQKRRDLEEAAAKAKNAATREQFLQEAQEAQDRQAQLAQKATVIAQGPEGTVKVTTFVAEVWDKAAFVKWVCNTQNFHLLDVAEGQLKKHVNANAGRNLPDGVRARREDVYKGRAS